MSWIVVVPGTHSGGVGVAAQSTSGGGSTTGPGVGRRGADREVGGVVAGVGERVDGPLRRRRVRERRCRRPPAAVVGGPVADEVRDDGGVRAGAAHPASDVWFFHERHLAACRPMAMEPTDVGFRQRRARAAPAPPARGRTTGGDRSVEVGRWPRRPGGRRVLDRPGRQVDGRRPVVVQLDEVVGEGAPLLPPPPYTSLITTGDEMSTARAVGAAATRAAVPTRGSSASAARRRAGEDSDDNGTGHSGSRG